MQIGRTSASRPSGRVRTCQDPGSPSMTPVTTSSRHAPEQRRQIATTSPTRGLDPPLTTAPQPRPVEAPVRRPLGTKEMNQMCSVKRSWQYSQYAVRWFAVVFSSEG